MTLLSSAMFLIAGTLLPNTAKASPWVVPALTSLLLLLVALMVASPLVSKLYACKPIRSVPNAIDVESPLVDSVVVVSLFDTWPVKFAFPSTIKLCRSMPN